MLVDVTVTIHVRVRAAGINRAENEVLEMLEETLADLAGRAGVVEAGVLLSPSNPTSRNVEP